MRRLATGLSLVVLLLAATVMARAPRGEDLTMDYTFDQYMKDFRKNYVRGSAEYTRRAALFKASLEKVLNHNARPGRKFTMGVNRMSDWTAAESKSVRGARFSPDHKSDYEVPFVPKGTEVPASLDWRTAQPSVLTAVKDQGGCGDCWAHAVTEAVESAYARATGDLYVLSQQQVTSCTPAVNTCQGCDGFYPKYAYDFIASRGENSTHGLVEEWFYSFTSWEGETGTCLTDKTSPWRNGTLLTSVAVAITGYTQVTNNSVSAVMEALNTLGPLSILVDATFWNEYESGVFTNCDMYGPGFALDHAVMLVGYGYDSSVDMGYWIVRNSWSAGWGEAGYIRIQRDSGAPQCGHTYTLSCNNQTHTWPACGPCGLLTDAQYPNVNVSRRAL